MERACRLIILVAKLSGALAQVRGIDMAGMAQHPARIAGNPQFDLIDPARMQRGEVRVKSLFVPRVERLPESLSTMRVEVVPYHTHLLAGYASATRTMKAARSFWVRRSRQSAGTSAVCASRAAISA
ncbi:hypothetical protein LMG29542_08658 [Paraburkholderia humisilvae]|uniref:Uncharacterized protein n=1 Tax=Paraburkholderia humisilvae TaxID=627669 RepID=A0A6J5FDD1_9BURK|nr:hypothetical protein LMG29542_08658 [Paraburkholderia humisilvae]